MKYRCKIPTESSSTRHQCRRV